MNFDAVFEGGGVKGIAFVGAICYLEEQGYKWKKCAGSSAGAIIASLLSAGYSGKELKEIMLETDYHKFLYKDLIQSINFFGKPLSLILQKGIYSTCYIERWISRLLEKKGKSKFKDVSINGKSNLKIIASDITKGELIILPDDLVKYGIDPMEFEIAKAVKMSISIPFYFKPTILKYKKNNKNKSSFIVDGGLLSNFPIWIFDIRQIPRWPTFGFKLMEDETNFTDEGNSDILSYCLDIVSTVINRNEEVYVKNKDIVRTIPIPTLGVKTTEFNISKEKSIKLFQSGYESAKKFLDKWDFEVYKNEYRIEV